MRKEYERFLRLFPIYYNYAGPDAKECLGY